MTESKATQRDSAPDSAQHAEWLRQQREGWSAAAAAWDEWYSTFESFAGPLGDELLERADVQPGARVLDVGCGNGELALAATRIVGAEGSVLGIDLAEPMIANAQRRATAAGMTNVQFRARSAEELADLGTFDAAVARFVLMLVPDPVAAARTIRAALRSSAPQRTARFAACVWGDATEVPFCAVAGRVLTATLGVESPAPDAPGPMRLGKPGQLSAVLRAAGFEDVNEAARTVEPRFESVEQAARFYCEGSSTVRRHLDAHTPVERERFLDGLKSALGAYRRDDGSVVMPSVVRIGWGSAG